MPRMMLHDQGLLIVCRLGVPHEGYCWGLHRRLRLTLSTGNSPLRVLLSCVALANAWRDRTFRPHVATLCKDGMEALPQPSL